MIPGGAGYFRHAFCVIVLATALIPHAQSQSRQSTQVPDHFEYFEGHAYMGSDRVTWQHNRLVFVKRVADMKGSFSETVEQFNPPPEAWERFWARTDSLGVWEWKSDYSDPKRDGPDGESWALAMGYGARQLKSKGYNAVPDVYSGFRDAVHKLMTDAR
jgi:hypothetical protein